MSFDELSTQLEDAGGAKKSYGDKRLWYPKTDEQKNGYAVIRFLPTSEKDDLPFVKMYAHGYKADTGQWYFENCPTTLPDGECPVCAANRVIVESYGGWDDTPKAVKDGVIRNRKRKLSYYSNIYVISDPATPENEGKVFLFKYGKKIYDQLMAATNPPFPDKEPIQPFDMWEGANYKLKIRQVEKQTNYDSSEFDVASQFLPTDAEMEIVYGQQYTLKEIISTDKFKPYVELETRFNRVEGGSKSTKTAETIDEPEGGKTEKVAEKPQFKKSAESTKPEATVAEQPTESIDSESIDSDDDDEDAMKYFAGLANDDDDDEK